MNAMLQYLMPSNSLLAGQQLEEGFERARKEGQTQREEEALREAAAQMGKGEYFTGYEGVPGATRPDYIKQLFAKGNPAVALQMEQALAAPYALQREIQKAGDIERLKKQADQQVWEAAIDKWRKSMTPLATTPPATAQSINAPMMEGETTAEPGTEPGTEPVGMPPQPLSNLPDMEETFKLSPSGPSLEMKRPSAFDKAVKADERRIAQENLNKDKEDLKVKKKLADVTIGKDQREAIEAAHARVKTIQEQIRQVRNDMSTHAVNFNDGKAAIKDLQAELKDATATRDALLRGKVSAPAPAAPAAPTAPQVRPVPSGTAPEATGTAPEPAFPIAPAVSTTPGLNEKEQAALNVKSAEEKVTATNKELSQLSSDAKHLATLKPKMDQVLQEAMKGIGHNTLGNIPGGQTAMRAMSTRLDNFESLHDEMAELFRKEGQSQLMNTLPELKIVTAALPSIAYSEDTNKKKAADLANKFHAIEMAPSFLEKWAKTHGGTFEGSADVWRDYVENNQPYMYREDARGHVIVFDKQKTLTPEQWMDYRNRNAVDIWIDSTGRKNIWLKDKDGTMVGYR